jgi:hypothetical protein
MNCINCGGEADISVCAILSTKKRRPRVQKSSKAIQLCGACIRKATIAQDAQVSGSVLAALQDAYTSVVSNL